MESALPPANSLEPKLPVLVLVPVLVPVLLPVPMQVQVQGLPREQNLPNPFPPAFV